MGPACRALIEIDWRNLTDAKRPKKLGPGWKHWQPTKARQLDIPQRGTVSPPTRPRPDGWAMIIPNPPAVPRGPGRRLDPVQMKVGSDLAAQTSAAHIRREEIGPGRSRSMPTSVGMSRRRLPGPQAGSAVAGRGGAAAPPHRLLDLSASTFSPGSALPCTPSARRASIPLAWHQARYQLPFRLHRRPTLSCPPYFSELTFTPDAGEVIAEPLTLERHRAALVDLDVFGDFSSRGMSRAGGCHPRARPEHHCLAGVAPPDRSAKDNP